MSMLGLDAKVNPAALDEAMFIAPVLVGAAVQKEADEIVRDLQGAGPNKAPKRSGRLRRAYKKRMLARGLNALIFADLRIAPHAGYVEFGTRRMSAQPHFRPAMKAGRRRLAKRASAMLASGFRSI